MEYKFLKAVIEGGVETRPDNVLIYATSNRRHLVQETWKDRDDMETRGDIHHSDTMEEKLSLSSPLRCDRSISAFPIVSSTMRLSRRWRRVSCPRRWTRQSCCGWPIVGKFATAASPAARRSSLFTILQVRNRIKKW